MNPENQSSSPEPLQPGSIPPQIITPGGVTQPQVVQPEVSPQPNVYGAAVPAVLPADQPLFAPDATSYNTMAASAKPRHRKKALLISGLAVLLLSGAGAGAYFGYYLPNTPENLWNTALTRTGKGYDKITNYISTQTKPKGYKIEGSFKSSGSIAADGNVTGATNGSNGQVSGTVSAVGLKLDFDVREISTNGNSPDIYFKVDGLQGIGSLLGGDAQLGAALNGINNQWYFVDHTLFDQFAAGSNTNLQFTRDDLTSALGSIGKASKQYLFTSDTSKQAVVAVKPVGKEVQDGKKVYHYKVALKKENVIAYAKSLCTNLKASKLNRFFGNSSSAVDQAIDCSSIDKDLQSWDYTKQADAWVDIKTKLIHKIRITQTNKPQNYFDISQDYNGGDSLPIGLVINTKDGTTTTNINIRVSWNMKNNSIELNGVAKETGDSNSTATIKLTVTPTNEILKIDAPKDAKTIIELLNNLGLSDFFGSGGDSNPLFADNVNDTERKTDIKALQGQLEAYYAQNAYYPTVANINDSSWRAVNMKGLDPEALRDPSSTSAVLVSSTEVGAYVYKATPSGCDNGANGDCTAFELSATLSDGTVFSVQSLN